MIDPALRVLVADDQPVIRGAFAAILDAAPDVTVVGEVEDGRQAVAEARRLQPDLVLMDIRMPGMDGIEATRRLAGPEVDVPIPVLVLTTFDLDEYVYAALTAGASGFLLKDVTRDALVHAVRTVAAGDALLAPSVTRRLVEEFAVRHQPDPVALGALDRLTEREREVLVRIGQGRTNAEIAADLVVGEATVKTHVNRLFAKLGVRDRVHAVIFAYEVALVRPGRGSG